MKVKRITKEDLQKIYCENDLKTATKKLGISVPCLYKYLERLDIPRKGKRSVGRNKKLLIIS